MLISLKWIIYAFSRQHVEWVSEWIDTFIWIERWGRETTTTKTTTMMMMIWMVVDTFMYEENVVIRYITNNVLICLECMSHFTIHTSIVLFIASLFSSYTSLSSYSYYFSFILYNFMVTLTRTISHILFKCKNVHSWKQICHLYDIHVLLYLYENK